MSVIPAIGARISGGATAEGRGPSPPATRGMPGDFVVPCPPRRGRGGAAAEGRVPSPPETRAMPEIFGARGLRGRGRARRRGVRPVLDLEGALVECERSRHDFLFAREAHDVRVPPGGELLEPHGLELRERDLGLRVELVAQAARLRHGLLGDRTSGDEDVEKDLPGPALHLPARRNDRENRPAPLGGGCSVLLAHAAREQRGNGRLLDGLAPRPHREDPDGVRALREALERVRLRRIPPRKHGANVVDEDLEMLPALRGLVLESLKVRELHLQRDRSALGGRLPDRGLRNGDELIRGRSDDLERDRARRAAPVREAQYGRLRVLRCSRLGRQRPDEYESETRDEGLHETRESQVRGIHGGSRTPYKLMSRPPDGVSERGGYQQERGRNMKEPGAVQSRVQRSRREGR